jgi:hypothetical protein
MAVSPVDRSAVVGVALVDHAPDALVAARRSAGVNAGGGVGQR